MIKILHITPHLGGGVGTVILNWLLNDTQNSHSIITLDYANENAQNICKSNNITLTSQPNNNFILDEIKKTDITVIHFWNHPLLYNFLLTNTIPNSRIAIWTHVSGAKPPQVFNPKLLDICDKFVFTTPVSYNFFPNDKKVACILSTAGAERFLDIKKRNHTGFNAGYIGTLDYAKMHPEYIKTLSATNVDKIYITGSGNNEKDFLSLKDKRFTVTGWVNDIGTVLSELDIFAYMLNPSHYGTGEQVIQEAMSAGVVPVVLNNLCEKSLIKHMETGLIAKNTNEYIQYVNLLKEKPELRETLSKNAKKYASENFSINTLITAWNKVFQELITIPKTKKEWTLKTQNLTSYDIFMESLGEHSKIFSNKNHNEIKNILSSHEWASDTKGSPKQYYKFLNGVKLKNIFLN